MNTNDLTVIDNADEFIPIYETDTGEKVVNGRELYQGLGVKDIFTNWMKNNLNSVNAENNDYLAYWEDINNVWFKLVVANENINSMVRKGYHINYILKLEIAKEICLVAGASPRANEQLKQKSKAYRKYLIQFEERYKNNLPQISEEDRAILNIVNAKDKLETATAIKNYRNVITKPLEEKINFIIENATTVKEFQRVMCIFVNCIANKIETNAQTVYNNLYNFLKKKEGMDLYTRCKNEKDRLQNERILSGKPPYSEKTLKDKCSIKSTIKKTEYEKVLHIIKAKAIEEGLTIKELNKALTFNLIEKENDENE